MNFTLEIVLRIHPMQVTCRIPDSLTSTIFQTELYTMNICNWNIVLCIQNVRRAVSGRGMFVNVSLGTRWNEENVENVSRTHPILCQIKGAQKKVHAR